MEDYRTRRVEIQGEAEFRSPWTAPPLRRQPPGEPEVPEKTEWSPHPRQAVAGNPACSSKMAADISHRSIEGSFQTARAIRYAGYYGLHIVCCFGLFLQWGQITRFYLAIGAASYLVRMFGLVAVNHRYFAHRCYKMRRGAQFFMALLGCLAVQRGPLWWSYSHNAHHRFSDTEKDPHSPWHKALWTAHVHWLLADETWVTDLSRVPARFKRCPELIWLERYELVVIGIFAASTLVFLGPWGFLWGYCISTVLIWHGMHAIGIFGHRFRGYRRYATADDSRNRWVLGLLTLGEGFQNNHHECQSSARLGFFWYEVDLAFYVLRLMERLGIVYGLHAVPHRIKHQPGRGFEARLRTLVRLLEGLAQRLSDLTPGLMAQRPDLDVEQQRHFEVASSRHLRAFASRGPALLSLGPGRFLSELEALRRTLLREADVLPDRELARLLNRELNGELDRFRAGCSVLRQK